MKNNRLYPAIFCLTITSIFSVESEAALISWQSPVNETGQITDILTTGDLFTAVASRTTATVGGVTFNAPTSSSTSGLNFDSKFKVLGNGYYSDLGANAPSTWDAGYQTLVSSGAVFSTGAQSLEISDLIAGDLYTIQIFQSFWDNTWATSFSDGTNTSAPVNFGTSSNVPQYLIGSFIADNTSQSISLGGPSQWHGFGAAQIRTQASSVPEPSALALMGLGLLGLRFRKKFN